MKKKLFSLILCLLIAVSLASPALAAHEYGKYYDETEELWNPTLETFGTKTLPSMAESYELDIRVDVLTSISDKEIETIAKYIYDEYEYGMGAGMDGVSLTVYVVADEDGWYVDSWTVYVGGSTPAWSGLRDSLTGALTPAFADHLWSNDVNLDTQAMAGAVAIMATTITDYAKNDTSEAPADVDISPVAATLDFSAEGNVIDLAGVLTNEQDATLENAITEIANPYQCGCYIVVTDNLYQYGDTAPDAVINLYHGNTLGIGDGRDGILLMLDPVNRKFAFFVYGENAEYIFNAYGQEQLETVFLDDFRNDLWYDGLEDFVDECGAYMELAAQGEPVSKSKTGYYAAAIGIAILISAIVCGVLYMQMKSVAEAREAAAYASGGLQLTTRSDRFLYKTTTTRDLSDDDDDSSSSSFSGGGGSGRSGSF